MMNLPKLSNNTDLPTLNGFAARSTWLILIAAAVQICSMFGIDLLAILGEMGIGASPEDVVTSAERAIGAWQNVAPLFLGVWAWIERRAPNFRLVWPWPRRSSIPPMIAILVAFGLVLANGAWAQQAVCGPRDSVIRSHLEQFGEEPVAVGDAARGHVELLLAPDGSFTVIYTRGGTSCVLATGVGWVFEPFAPSPPGDPA